MNRPGKGSFPFPGPTARPGLTFRPCDHFQRHYILGDPSGHILSGLSGIRGPEKVRLGSKPIPTGVDGNLARSTDLLEDLDQVVQECPLYPVHFLSRLIRSFFLVVQPFIQGVQDRDQSGRLDSFPISSSGPPVFDQSFAGSDEGVEARVSQGIKCPALRASVRWGPFGQTGDKMGTGCRVILGIATTVWAQTG